MREMVYMVLMYFFAVGCILLAVRNIKKSRTIAHLEGAFPSLRLDIVRAIANETKHRFGGNYRQEQLVFVLKNAAGKLRLPDHVIPDIDASKEDLQNAYDRTLEQYHQVEVQLADNVDLPSDSRKSLTEWREELSAKLTNIQKGMPGLDETGSLWHSVGV